MDRRGGLDGDGHAHRGRLTLDVRDISVVEPSFAGSLSLHYKTPLSDEVLTRVPQRSFAFDVPPPVRLLRLRRAPHVVAQNASANLRSGQ